MNIEKTHLVSCLAPVFDKYIDKCIAEHADSTLHNDYAAIKHFDAYLESISFSGDNLSDELLCGWVATLSHLENGTIHHHECVINKALRFARAFGINSVVIPIIKVTDSYQPYIFTESEINKICAAADNMTFSKKAIFPWLCVEFPMIVRILIGCGTRITETTYLQMKDIDLKSGILIMRHCKEGRERIVPMHDSLRQIMERYCMAMGVIGNPDAWIFPGKSRKAPIDSCYFSKQFAKLLLAAGIKTNRKKKYSHCASTHCLRHTFACNSLQNLQRQGIYVDNTFPYLSTFMGHKNLYDTQKYLKLTSEMVSEETILFEDSIKDVFDSPIFHDDFELEIMEV